MGPPVFYYRRGGCFRRFSLAGGRIVGGWPGFLFHLPGGVHSRPDWRFGVSRPACLIVDRTIPGSPASATLAGEPVLRPAQVSLLGDRTCQEISSAVIMWNGIPKRVGSAEPFARK